MKSASPFSDFTITPSPGAPLTGDRPADGTGSRSPMALAQRLPQGISVETGDALLADILGRNSSLFSADMAAHRAELREVIGGTRLLVAGGAGSIGRAFIRAVLKYRPAAVDVVDPSENSLVALIRNVRSSSPDLATRLTTYSIGIGSVEFAAFMAAADRYDYVINFAALKHVRAERDPYSMMRLLQVNVAANELLLQLTAGRLPRRYFAVSSDKAVNPANVMGASKALMERLYLSPRNPGSFTSARFANVAFSDGSLLDGFLRRFEQGQPLAAPQDIRRYFISAGEAAEICLLACFLARDREIAVPRMTPELHAQSLTAVAEMACRRLGYEPVRCETPAEAVRRARARAPGDPWWPCFFAPTDTSGEKDLEEFASSREECDTARFTGLVVITKPLQSPPERLQHCLEQIAGLYRAGRWTREQILEAVRTGVPELRYVDRTANLDQKM